MPPVRRLAAILAADVAGYSRLIGADEMSTLARLRTIRADVLDPAIAANNGRLVKTTGDGLLAEFASTVDALRCAQEVQVSLSQRNAGFVPDNRIDYRIGIHQGDIVVEDGDIFGDGVNIAARLETLAEPGGICVSARVQEDATGKLDLTFRDMGEQQLKNIARPIRAYMIAGTAATLNRSAAPRLRPFRVLLAMSALITLVALSAATWWAFSWHVSPPTSPRAPAISSATLHTHTAEKPKPRLSIVVLPFENLSTDPEQGYFADAVTDDLTTDLSRIKDSFVIARTTAFTYKDKAIDVRKIASDLGVSYVLEGSVRRLGDQVQLNAQLIDGETGAHLWADRFDADRRNLVAEENEITGRLALTLNRQLVLDIGRRIEHEKTADPDARDLIMRARALEFRGFSKENHQNARALFERALALDPHSDDAKLAIASSMAGDAGLQSSGAQQTARAEQLALQALEDDPNRPKAHEVLGEVRRIQWRRAEAQTELETAIRLDPNNARALRLLGQILFIRGRAKAAIPYFEKAIRLDPYSPGVFVAHMYLGGLHLVLGDTDEAVKYLRQAEAGGPAAWFVHMNLAAALGVRGDLAEAKREIAAALELKPDANSVARLRALGWGTGEPPEPELVDKSVFAGLRRAGFPEE